MDEDIYDGYSTTTDLRCEKDENGFWSVHLKMTQGRAVDGEWKTKSVETTAVGEDLSKSIQDASLTIVAYLDSVDGDLFNEVPKFEEDSELPN